MDRGRGGKLNEIEGVNGRKGSGSKVNEIEGVNGRIGSGVT